MTFMTLLNTTACRSHFQTKTVGIPGDYIGDAMEAGMQRVHPELGVYRVTAQNLDETTIEYLSYLPGDTPDDEKRRQQINYLDDDIESLADAEYYERKERGEGEQDAMDEEYNIPDTLRQRQERERHDRRHSRRDAVLPERYK
eukprot:1541758-Amphidinium_carterae.1